MTEEYEALCISIAMLDASIEYLESIKTQDDAVSILHALRNDLNTDRVACLGNGQDRPYYVSDLGVHQ